MLIREQRAGTDDSHDAIRPGDPITIQWDRTAPVLLADITGPEPNHRGDTMSDDRDQLNILAPVETKVEAGRPPPPGRAGGRPSDVASVGPRARGADAALGAAAARRPDSRPARAAPRPPRPVAWPGSRWRTTSRSSTGRSTTTRRRTRSSWRCPRSRKAGLKIHETYYSSNDELLAKLNAGGTTYDIIAPSQNAVAQLIQEGKLLAMDPALLPNLKNLDPKFLKASYDPTGQYHVIKDYGITMIFYNNQIVTEQPQTMHDFYALLPEVRQQGPDQPARRCRGGRAAGADGSRARPQHRAARTTSPRCPTT